MGTIHEGSLTEKKQERIIEGKLIPLLVCVTHITYAIFKYTYAYIIYILHTNNTTYIQIQQKH